jgi:hypothetical protein
MQRPFRLQISDLEDSQSNVEQELTTEEAEKIFGGGHGKFCPIPPSDLDDDLFPLPCRAYWSRAEKRG